MTDTKQDEVYTVSIDKPKHYPDNPRRGDIPAIMRSLERFGQVKPIIVQKSTGYVVAGNHVLDAARELGWTSIKCLVMDLDDDAARAYLIADNRTSDRGGYNRDALIETLGQVLDLGGTGFEDEDGFALVEDEIPDEKDDLVKQEEARREPMREILLVVPMSEMDEFVQQIEDLQEYWGRRTTVEAIRRAINVVHAAIIREKPEPPPVLKQGVDF